MPVETPPPSPNDLNPNSDWVDFAQSVIVVPEHVLTMVERTLLRDNRQLNPVEIPVPAQTSPAPRNTQAVPHNLDDESIHEPEGFDGDDDDEDGRQDRENPAVMVTGEIRSTTQLMALEQHLGRASLAIMPLRLGAHSDCGCECIEDMGENDGVWSFEIDQKTPERGRYTKPMGLTLPRLSGTAGEIERDLKRLAQEADQMRTSVLKGELPIHFLKQFDKPLWCWGIMVGQPVLVDRMRQVAQFGPTGERIGFSSKFVIGQGINVVSARSLGWSLTGYSFLMTGQLKGNTESQNYANIGTGMLVVLDDPWWKLWRPLLEMGFIPYPRMVDGWTDTPKFIPNTNGYATWRCSGGAGHPTNYPEWPAWNEAYRLASRPCSLEAYSTSSALIPLPRLVPDMDDCMEGIKGKIAQLRDRILRVKKANPGTGTLRLMADIVCRWVATTLPYWTTWTAYNHSSSLVTGHVGTMVLKMGTEGPEKFLPGREIEQALPTHPESIAGLVGRSGILLPGLMGGHYGWTTSGMVRRGTRDTSLQEIFWLGYKGVYGLGGDLKPLVLDSCSDAEREGQCPIDRQAANSPELGGRMWGRMGTQTTTPWLKTLLDTPGQELNTETDTLSGVVRGATGLLHRSSL